MGAGTLQDQQAGGTKCGFLFLSIFPLCQVYVSQENVKALRKNIYQKFFFVLLLLGYVTESWDVSFGLEN